MINSVIFCMTYSPVAISEISARSLEGEISLLWPTIILIVISFFVTIALLMKNGRLKNLYSSVEVSKIFKWIIRAKADTLQKSQKQELQESEPSKKKNALFCDLCKMSELYKLPPLLRVVAAYSRLTEIKMFELLLGNLDAISTNQEDAWNHSKNILRNFDSEKTIIHMTSLINPKTWGIHDEWKEHHENIRNIAMYRGSIARRLHVMRASDLDDEMNIRIVFNLMLAEYLCNIRARLLCIKPEDTTSLVIANDTSEALFRWHNFCLFDYATLTTTGGLYGVIFTDIQSYFIKESCLDFNLFGKITTHCDLYYILRQNFYEGWNQNRPSTLFTLFDLFEFAKTKGFDNIVDNAILHSLIPRGVEKKLPAHGLIEHLLKTSIECYRANPYYRYKTEDALQQQLGELIGKQ